MKKPLESDIQKQILQYLSLLGIVHWRQNSGAFVVPAGAGSRRRYVRAGMPGVSDIIGLLPNGRFLAIEVKRPGEQPTELQQAFLSAVNHSGGLAFVARSVNDVQSTLEAHL